MGTSQPSNLAFMGHGTTQPQPPPPPPALLQLPIFVCSHPTKPSSQAPKPHLAHAPLAPTRLPPCAARQGINPGPRLKCQWLNHPHLHKQPTQLNTTPQALPPSIPIRTDTPPHSTHTLRPPTPSRPPSPPTSASTCTLTPHTTPRPPHPTHSTTLSSPPTSPSSSVLTAQPHFNAPPSPLSPVHPHLLLAQCQTVHASQPWIQRDGP